jgi:hypothetical protein
MRNDKVMFYNSVSVLVTAFLNDTLQHGNCHTCAVGNFVAAANNFKYENHKIYKYKKVYNGGRLPAWQEVFMTIDDDQFVDLKKYRGEAKEQIDSTGYTYEELAKIEYAFETADRGYLSEDHMFNGLMSCVDVLAEIHNIDLSVREEAKLLFKKPVVCQ